VSVSRSDRLRAIGWLLTPLVVWAASFCGAWLGAVVAAHLDPHRSGIAVMAGGAVLVAGLATLLWIVVLRHGRGTQAPKPPSEP
jgi:hypothetical protein